MVNIISSILCHLSIHFEIHGSTRMNNIFQLELHNINSMRTNMFMLSHYFTEVFSSRQCLFTDFYCCFFSSALKMFPIKVEEVQCETNVVAITIFSWQVIKKRVSSWNFQPLSHSNDFYRNIIKMNWYKIQYLDKYRQISKYRLFSAIR